MKSFKRGQIIYLQTPTGFAEIRVVRYASIAPPVVRCVPLRQPFNKPFIDIAEHKLIENIKAANKGYTNEA